MGAWGSGTFDNDTACDWVSELEETEDLSVVSETLQQVVDAGDEDLDSDEACMALAAAEVLARLKGKWGVRNSYTEGVDAWVKAHPQKPPKKLLDLATATVDRILTPPSELLELWTESDSLEEWKAAVEDLRSRLK